MKRQKLSCGFCHSSNESKITGPLLNKDDVVAHRNCLFYSSNIVNQNTPDDDDLMGFLPEHVKEEIKRGNRLKCAKCKRTGATVGCELKKCPRSYHYPCAVLANAENIEDDDNGIFKIYCSLHKNKDDSDGSSNSVVKRKRPRLSLRAQARKILDDDSSATDDSKNGYDSDLAPLESDLEDSRDLKGPSPNQDVLERSLTDEPKPSTSGVFLHEEAESETMNKAKPPTVVENETESPHHLGGTCRIESPKNQASNDHEHLHNGDTDETDIESAPESDSLLMPLKITQVVSVASDQSGPSTLEQQPNLPATPRPPEPSLEHSDTGNTASVSGCEPWAQARSRATAFWRKCREAGCVETIFHTFTSAMNRISERIINEQASEEDCVLSLRVLEASDLLPEIFAEKDKEYEARLLTLQREIEAVSKSRAAATSAGRMKSSEGF